MPVPHPALIEPKSGIRVLCRPVFDTHNHIGTFWGKLGLTRPRRSVCPAGSGGGRALHRSGWRLGRGCSGRPRAPFCRSCRFSETPSVISIGSGRLSQWQTINRKSGASCAIWITLRCRVTLARPADTSGSGERASIDGVMPLQITARRGRPIIDRFRKTSEQDAGGSHGESPASAPRLSPRANSHRLVSGALSWTQNLGRWFYQILKRKGVNRLPGGTRVSKIHTKR